MEKLEQLHTGDYLLIVDNSEIKEGDLVWNGESKPYKWTKEDVEDAFNYKDNKGCKKIIAHLPFDNSPILDGIDLLPPLEDEIEKLAQESISMCTLQDKLVFKEGYYKGYTHYQEDMADKSKQKTLKEDSSSYQLAKNFFTEIYGYAPEIIEGNLQHEIIVAALQKGMVYSAKWQQEQFINSLNKQD